MRAAYAINELKKGSVMKAITRSSIFILVGILMLSSQAFCENLTVYWACDDRADFMLNGKKIDGEHAYFAPNSADSVYKATVDVKPYDTLGFACANIGGGRHLLVAVFKDSKYLFGSSDDAWVCTDPSETKAYPDKSWWTGKDPSYYPAIANRDWAKGKSIHGGIIDFFRTIGSTPPDCWPIWGKNDSVAFMRTVVNPEDLNKQ